MFFVIHNKPEAGTLTLSLFLCFCCTGVAGKERHLNICITIIVMSRCFPHFQWPWRSQQPKDSHDVISKTKSSTRTDSSETSASRRLTVKERLVEDFIGLLDAHQEFDSVFAAKADILYKDAPMTVNGYQEEMNKVFRSFPDFSLVVKGSIHESGQGIVVADLCCERGTHTGEPYGFGPYPEIPISGKHVRSDLS